MSRDSAGPYGAPSRQAWFVLGGKHNADLFFRLLGNSKAERHWHSSAERMVLISGELQVDYDGQDPVVMRPGTYAYGPAKLPHSATCRLA